MEEIGSGVQEAMIEQPAKELYLRRKLSVPDSSSIRVRIVIGMERKVSASRTKLGIGLAIKKTAGLATKKTAIVPVIESGELETAAKYV